MKSETDLVTTESLYSNIPLALLLSSLAGAATGLGGLLTVLQTNVSKARLGYWQGAAAGFMLSVCVFDLLPTLLKDVNPFRAAVFIIAGAALFVILRVHIPEPDLESMGVKGSEKEVLWSGLLTAAGISLHNFPEGIAVCIASLKGLKFGLPLAIAIGLHNIPEGMAVALPLYYATKNKWYAVKMAFLSGLAEPAGVIFVLGFITVIGALTREFVACGMAAVVGVMAVLSLWELMPQAIRYGGWGGAVSAVIGFLVMAALLSILESLGLGV